MAKKSIEEVDDNVDIFSDDDFMDPTGGFPDVLDDDPNISIAEEGHEDVNTEQDPEPKTRKRTSKPIVEEEDDDEVISGDKSGLQIFAEMQRESGLISYEDDEFEDSDDFIIRKTEETINSNIATGIEEYKNSLPDKVKAIIENYEDGLSLEDSIKSIRSIEYYENITDEKLKGDVNLQKSIIKEYYESKGFSQDKIDKKLVRLEASDELDVEAEEALEEIVEIKQKELENNKIAIRNQEAERAKASKEWEESFKGDIAKRTEIIKGIPLSPADKKELISAVLDVDRNGKNEIARIREADPDFDLKVLYLSKIMKWDLGNIKKQAESDSKKSLRDALSSGTKTGKTVSTDSANFARIARKSLRYQNEF